MEIAYSSVHYASSRVYQATHQVNETLSVWRDGGTGVVGGAPADGGPPVSTGFTAAVAGSHNRVDGDLAGTLLDNVAAQRRMLPSPNAGLSTEAAAPGARTGEASPVTAETPDDVRMMLMKALVERMTGREIEVLRPEELTEGVERADVPAGRADAQRYVERAPDVNARYERSESLSERETTRFSAHATVMTADGQKLDVRAALTMDRQYRETREVTFNAGSAATDPIVLNYSGNAADLSGERFDFDLDGDGDGEAIPSLASGSLSGARSRR